MNGTKISLLDATGQGITAEAKRVIEDLTRGTGGIPTVFVGSGVSIWKPSDLPSGQDFTRALFSVLFAGPFAISAAERILLEEMFGRKWSPHFSGMPFEHLMECCPSEAKANMLVNRLYDSRSPNPLHRALAKGIKDGKIHSIITTNYDCCLDEALSDEGFSFVKAVTPEQALAARRVGVPRYFTIHGSVEGGLETSPMFTLRHEGLLHPHKRALLTELTEGRKLVMLGYSGLDFELCPEIERLAVADLVWNNLRDYYPSVSAERLIGIKNGTLLYGDMRILLARWLGMTDRPENVPSKEAHVLTAVRDIFDDEEVGMWRVRVLNSLGMPSFTLRALGTIDASHAPFFFTVERGRAEFHAGRYKRSRRHFQRAFLTALAARRWHCAADAALETSDAYRTYGAPLRAYACTWAVPLFAARQSTAKKLLKQSLVIRDMAEVARSLQRVLRSRVGAMPLIDTACRTLTEMLLQVLSGKLSNCAREALPAGNWIDFQQVSLIAEGAGVRLPTTDEFYSPPKAAEGYKHLGYYIPQTMIFTAECLKDRGRLSASPEMRCEWRRHVKLCRRLGLNAALWKVLILRHSPKVKARARGAFRQCDYGKLKGFLDWNKYSS
jgi:hypothetical protein